MGSVEVIRNRRSPERPSALVAPLANGPPGKPCHAARFELHFRRPIAVPHRDSNRISLRSGFRSHGRVPTERREGVQPSAKHPPSIPPKRFGWEAEQGGVDPATVSPPGGARTRRSRTKRPRTRVHRPLELRAQATFRPPNRTPDFAHLIRALDEPVARRFVRAALTPSPIPNSFAPTQPGRSKARSFADSSASSFVCSEPTPRLPPPLTFLASSFRPGLLTDSSSPEPPSFLASTPSTLRSLSPHLLSPPNPTGTAPGPRHLPTPFPCPRTDRPTLVPRLLLPARPPCSLSFVPSYVSLFMLPLPLSDSSHPSISTK